jgi:hypothetical protein
MFIKRCFKGGEEFVLVVNAFLQDSSVVGTMESVAFRFKVFAANKFGT